MIASLLLHLKLNSTSFQCVLFVRQNTVIIVQNIQWCIVNYFFLFLDRYAIDSIEWHKNNVWIKKFDTPGKFWWITGSRRYDKNYSPDKGIHKMYIQKPTKPSLSIHCATLFQKPLIILCNFGGWMLYQHNFLTELRLEI